MCSSYFVRLGSVAFAHIASVQRCNACTTSFSSKSFVVCFHVCVCPVNAQTGNIDALVPLSQYLTMFFRLFMVQPFPGLALYMPAVNTESGFLHRNAGNA